MTTTSSTSRTVQHVATSFGDIAITDTGEGDLGPGAPVALFVHGVFVNGHLWRHVVERVRDLRRCITVDILAHGETRTPADQDLSFKAQAEMLEAVVEALGLDQVDLVANDSGGGIAQIFAARHPERIRTLTLTNCDVHDNWPPAALEPTRELIAAGGFEELAGALLADVEAARAAFAVAYEHPEEVSEETFRTYLGPLVASPEAVRNFERWFGSIHDCADTVEVESLLRELTAPTLVVWGTGDVFFDRGWAHWLKGTIPGCDRVIEIEGAKLFFPEERPDEMADALRGHWT